ncbi:MAG: hypothetical protein LQ352_003330 [Teloschistes flavicans]|nr:MAG: hypothetical protein LQ352_003330 [Teloschistes flavicans]
MSTTHPHMGDLNPSSDQLFLSTLSLSAQSFLQPTPALHTAALVLAKRYLDPLASSATQAQAERLNAQRRQRRRGQKDHHASKNPFRMRQVYLDGFPTPQVWEQARKVLDASLHDVEAQLEISLTAKDSGGPPAQTADDGHSPRKRVRIAEDEHLHRKAVQEPPASDTASQDQRDRATERAETDEDLDADKGADGIHGDQLAAVNGEGSDIDMDSEAQSDVDEMPQDIFVPDKHGLNDGFFSIDEFNKQSDFLEDQDARGEPESGTSDEEEIDWAAEPPPLPEGPDVDNEYEVNEDDDENGPTFGNADLNAPDTESNPSDVELAMQDMGPPSNTNDIMYAAFFAPPARKATKSTRRRALPKTQPTPSSIPEQEDDVDRTIAAVRRDIFEDDVLSAGEDDTDADSAVDPGDPRSRRSNHERRQAKLAAEIRRLEAANVAKRDWTLSGEARAADRPLNSLLEEDLDFERAGKPVPVITNEVSEDIEALIKRRIIDRDFDEVIRRRPGDLATAGAKAARRGRFELDDTKPQQSLADVYEAEHLRRVDPDGHIDKRDEKLKKEHAAIEELWADISAKLDALSNWHYKPKPPQANITVVADVPTVSMEDARPSAGEGMGGAATSMLAPQEMYKPGEERSREDKRKEVVLKSGVPVAREEMSREEKLRRRRREKERIKKSGGGGGGRGGGSAAVAPPAAINGLKKNKAEEKKGVVGDLKRGGVRVIGKKGELVDVEGKAVKASKEGGAKGGGSYKL